MKITNEQDAIKQAVEAGYEYGDLPEELEESEYETILLSDPAFWQALGRARGWFEGEWKPSSDELPHSWKHYAFEWFQTRLSTGDLEAFWQSLP